MIIIPKDKKSVNIYIPKGYGDIIEITDVNNLEIRDIVITENGSTTITHADGYYALSEVNVNVAVPDPELENIVITENGEYRSDKYGYGIVNVDVQPELENITITENGKYKSDYYGYGEVDVNVQPDLRKLDVTANGLYQPEGFDGYNEVNVAIPPKGLDIDFSSIGWSADDINGYTAKAQSDLDYTITVLGKKIFSGDTQLVYAPMVTGLTTCRGMFSGCTSLQFVPEYDVSNVTSLVSMFDKCTLIQDITGIEDWDVSNVTHTSQMFRYCTALSQLNLSKWNTSNVIYTTQMFNECRNIKSIDVSGWDTSKLIGLEQMFNYCQSLTDINGLENWNTSNISNMIMMFNNCSGLQTLDLGSWDTTNLSSCSSMFAYCQSLTEINGLENWNTSNIIKMDSMFYSMSKLSYINLSGWDFNANVNVNNMFAFGYGNGLTINLTFAKMNKIKSMYNMFNYCYLKDIILDGVTLPDIQLNNVGFDNSYSKLTVDSLVGILNALPVSTNGYTLKLGTTNLNKLSNEQKMIATNKGWTLS